MLLDTQALIWFLEGNRRLGPTSRGAIQEASVVHASAASVWEIAIKVNIGGLTAPDDLLSQIQASGFELLPISPVHAWAVRNTAGLPHRDPFDRLLVTQALVEEIPFVTADRAILAADVDGLVTVDARE